MRISVRFENGKGCEALVLAAGGNRLRVAVAGGRDVEEWLMIDGSWFNESGLRVDIEALVALDGLDYSAMSDEARPKAAVAGRFN